MIVLSSDSSSCGSRSSSCGCHSTVLDKLGLLHFHLGFRQERLCGSRHVRVRHGTRGRSIISTLSSGILRTRFFIVAHDTRRQDLLHLGCRLARINPHGTITAHAGQVDSSWIVRDSLHVLRVIHGVAVDHLPITFDQLLTVGIMIAAAAASLHRSIVTVIGIFRQEYRMINGSREESFGIGAPA